MQTGATLEIGGSSTIQSGITCDTKILVLKKVTIGKDFGCSWNCFISDSDWHGIEHGGKPSPSQSDIKIGDRVWICPDCSILKGTVISNDSIVGTKSLLRGKSFPPNSLIAGIPARAVEGNVKWRGDLPPLSPDGIIWIPLRRKQSLYLKPILQPFLLAIKSGKCFVTFICTRHFIQGGG